MLDPNDKVKLTLGERVADMFADFGGSWVFIGSFFLFLIGWMCVNIWLLRAPFDPYPFILLNLILSTVAAIQAPMIMMSQRRQEARDRARILHDLEVDIEALARLKKMDAEVNEKLDSIMEKMRRLQGGS